MTELEIRREASVAHAPQPIANEPAGAMRLVEWAREAEAAHHLASALVRTPFAGSWKGDIDGATAAILKGSEVGLTPVTALGAFDNIQGTPAPKAITLRALVQSHGHDLEIIEETDERATARYRRNGKGDWLETTFTMDHARSMRLDKKDNWVKQPAAMLVARVTSKAARLVASDVILGIGYSAEEVRDEAPWDGTTQTPRQVQAASGADRMAAVLSPAASDVASEPAVDDAVAEQSPLLNTSSALAKAMYAAIKEHGVPEDERIVWLGNVIGREIGSSKEMTDAEARDVLAFIDSEGGEEPEGGEQS